MCVVAVVSSQFLTYSQFPTNCFNFLVNEDQYQPGNKQDTVIRVPVMTRPDCNKDLEEKIVVAATSLARLVIRCSEKTELGCFLASLASEFSFEEANEEDLRPAGFITIEEELAALG